MTPAIERLDHVALLAQDAAASAAFYCEWAGMEVIHERSDGAEVRWVRLKDDPTGLIIVILGLGEEGQNGHMDHFGFHVPGRADVDAIAARAKAAGILVEGPKYSGPVVGYWCEIRDPDGNQLEFSCDQLKA
jgi:catechol 2,3-dioxygenase-like lactoylglutathione lyase family enzyme